MSLVYLDNAATLYPKSNGVFAAMRAAFFGCGNGGRGGHPLAFAAAETVYGCREKLAALFGTVPEKVVLCSGATLAINMAIKGVMSLGGAVLCSNLEHNAVLRPLYALAAAGSIRQDFFAPSFVGAEKTVSNFAAALRADTKLAVFTHASNVCGMCLPVKELCAVAKERRIITVVDCAQTAGHIPIDIKDLGADIICLAGHKGMGGPMGIGAMVINPSFTRRINTFIEGGTGMASRERAMPPVLPERLEAGTANITGIAGLSAACDELSYATAEEEQQRQMLVEGLRRINGVQVYGADSNAAYAPMALFNVKGQSADAVAEKLAARGICVRGGLHCAPLAHVALGTGRYGAVRASIGRYNTAGDCLQLLAAVADISAGKI